jgi:hypothetical protein
MVAIRKIKATRPTVTHVQGCQMVYFQIKNHNLGNLWRSLDWKMLMYLMAFGKFTDICDILGPFGTFYVHLVHFFRFWYHVPRKNWQPWCMDVCMRPVLSLSVVRIKSVFPLVYLNRSTAASLGLLLGKKGQVDNTYILLSLLQLGLPTYEWMIWNVTLCTYCRYTYNYFWYQMDNNRRFLKHLIHAFVISISRFDYLQSFI